MSKKGFTMVELLLSMAIFGVLMTAVFFFFTSNQKVVGQQISAASLDNTLRLALARVDELVSQASYIYPADQTLVINGASYTTGAKLLAVLVAEGSTYCADAGGQSYCGYAYSIEDRKPYEAILGEGDLTTGLALVEHVVTGIAWPQHGIPSLNWSSAPITYPLADSIAASSSIGAKLETASFTSFDRSFTFATINATDSLINAVESDIIISLKHQGKDLKSERSSYAYARSIPRGALPKPNQ